MKNLFDKIHACRVCEKFLPLGPRPIVQGHPESQILIVSQAPGLAVHETGIPWNDPSGNRLREWLGLSKEIFYNSKSVALLPIGFCYPGRATSGDAPPRKECHALWHDPFRAFLKNVRLTFLVGRHAQTEYLKTTLDSTTIIRTWRDYLPEYVVLPHPSPRNNIWLHRNPWFMQTVIPEVRSLVADLSL